MKIKFNNNQIDNFLCVTGFVYTFSFSLLYFSLISMPALLEGTDIAIILGDAYTYLGLADGDLNFIPVFDSKINGAYFGLFGVGIISYLTSFFSADTQLVIIYIFNSALLFFSLIFFYKIVISYKVSSPGFRVMVLALCSPFFIISSTFLNKESVGIFFVLSTLYYSDKQQWGKYWLVAVACGLFRDVYILVSVSYYILSKFDVKKTYFLFVLSVSCWLFIDYDLNSNAHASIGQRSFFIMNFTNNISEEYPLGYFFVFPIKALVQLFGPIASLDLYRFFIEYYYSSLVLSSLVIFGLSFPYVKYVFFNIRYKFDNSVFNLLFVYLSISALSPHSIHRVFSPLLVLFFLNFYVKKFRAKYL